MFLVFKIINEERRVDEGAALRFNDNLVFDDDTCSCVEVAILWDAKFTQILTVTLGGFDNALQLRQLQLANAPGRNWRGLDTRLQVSRGASEYSIPFGPYCRNV